MPDNSIIDTDIEAYHADTQRIGSTGLKLVHRSPAHYYAQYLAPDRVIKPPTPAMLLGKYTHCAILEPGRFWDKYACIDDAEICASLRGGGVRSPRATKEYQRWFTVIIIKRRCIAMEWRLRVWQTNCPRTSF